ncbi:hypothetical protein PGIGA_G00053600 [Pangasianodon gigas]|uniref:Uncharacterized protein n=1 Tax=Pangasianodon gigas TaxID=30993 RepID=A0ACC5X439_PANGG|nr:hypothetical protein [Pangasianodon gigas]
MIPDGAMEPVLVPQPQFHAQLSHTTHKVCDDSLQPDNIDLKVFDPSTNSQIQFILKSTDTPYTLTKKYLQMRPELGENLHLAYNGNPVTAQKSLRELGVKSVLCSSPTRNALEDKRLDITLLLLSVKFFFHKIKSISLLTLLKTKGYFY